MPDPAADAGANPAAQTTTAKRWTTRELLQWMSGNFRDRGIDSPRVCAEMLLAHVVGCERLRLYMDADRPASPDELATLREFVRRAIAQEPVQYLVGHAWFFSRKFEVGPPTLIPRPSTETLVELGIRALRSIVAPPGGAEEAPVTIDPEATIDPDETVDMRTSVGADAATVDTATAAQTVRVLDLCTGTGCIAISIAAAVPSATIVATDLVPEAIDLAQRNANAHAVADRIEFRTGSLWSALDRGDGPFDLICANPPYVSDAEWAEVAPNVRDHEPPTALRGGADGLDLVRPIVEGAAARLAPAGTLLVEISFSQEAAVLAIAAAAGFSACRVEKDHEGHPRVLIAQREPKLPAAGES